MRIVIRIYDLKTGDELEEKRTKLVGDKAKLWFAGLVVWACARGYGVQVVHEKDDQDE